MRKFFKAFNFISFGLLLWGVIALGFFAPGRTILQQANLNPPPYAPMTMDNPAASFAALETAIYGQFTPPTLFELKSKEILSTDWLDGRATVEQQDYWVSHGQAKQVLEIIFVTPTSNPDAPLIISQNFSSNRNVISANGLSPVSGTPFSMGPLDGIFKFFFGRYIVEPPLADILDRGYGFVAFHPPSYVADQAGRGTAQLDTIFGGQPSHPGALLVWTSLTTALAQDLKESNPDRPILAYGHSRYGKTALLSAA